MNITNVVSDTAFNDSVIDSVTFFIEIVILSVMQRHRKVSDIMRTEYQWIFGIFTGSTLCLIGSHCTYNRSVEVTLFIAGFIVPGNLLKNHRFINFFLCIVVEVVVFFFYRPEFTF